MDTRAFAKHVGVSHKVISKWTAGGHPALKSQAVLDESLAEATPEQQARFWTLLEGCSACGQPPTRITKVRI